MLALARSPQRADRDRLLFALTELCERDGVALSPQSLALLGDVAVSLLQTAEHAIRLRLAERLAAVSWAPHAMVVALVHDDIDIARHLIASSPLLGEQDLLRLLLECALEHRIEVAARPGLAAGVVEAILDEGSPEVLSALAANETAEISPQAMARMIDCSRTVAAMRAPLSRHPRLTPEIGAALYAWVGEALRRSLHERFAVDGPAFQAAIDASVREAQASPYAGVGEDGDERAAMDRRVVEKLKAGGQLRPGFLLRALRDGKLTLFMMTLASLGEFTPEQVRAAIDAPGPELLALACASVGVDRGALPTIVAFVRSLNEGLPGRDQDAASLNRITTLADRSAAARLFREKAPC